ncbi:YggT family protein [Kordiimonas sediminis]|uniref:YggT family protein n=1 Tax=Kordiimonas sediminis TaxID=1735581 RepID=A0A919ALU2_9PROT|nr:YggT family protein [Kordiimonas sediminis]GHF14202.1 YggT family protein [Kordiimonas sediminis]
MTALFWLVDTVLGFYALLVLVSIILHWLVAFNIINAYQPFMRSVMAFLYAITEPILSKIRQVIPAIGGMDLSPLILLLAIHFVRILLATSVAPALGVYGY